MTGAIVAATGPQDWIVSPDRRVIVENGHPMMEQVTGMGCMLTAVVGAFAAVERDPLVAAASAISFFGLSGEQAALRTDGPGTFKLALLDTLFSLTADHMRNGMKLKD
jgi:hydroxyethylthiazole kinase